MMQTTVNPSVDLGKSCTFELVGAEKNLYMCWCKKKCLLGEGSFGRVFKGKWKENPESDSLIEVAVKHPYGPHHVDYEIATLVKANEHRNILKFYGQVRFGPDRLIVTELCHGTLNHLVTVNKNSSIKLSSDQLRDVVLHQIVEGVKHLHDNNIIHRDLNPRNILYRIIISDEGKRQLVMKVADFGSSRHIKEGANRYPRSMIDSSPYSKRFCPSGTDGYHSADALRGNLHIRPIHAADIFALGIVFATTLREGKHPIDEDGIKSNNAIRNNEPLPDITQRELKALGNGCYDLINWMLNPNPEWRPTTDEILKNNYFTRVIRNPLEVELLELCQLSKLENDDLTRFIQLATDKEAVDVNCTDGIGRTPLTLLCLNNESDSLDFCVKILLQHRPDIDVTLIDEMGFNALMNLSRHSESDKIVEVAQLLIRAGVDVKQVDKYGTNALMLLCAYSKNKKIVEMAQFFIIDNEVDLNQVDKYETNALMLLFFLKHYSRNEKIVEMAQLLIDKGVNINQTDQDEKTAEGYLKENTSISDDNKSTIRKFINVKINETENVHFKFTVNC